MKNLLYIIIGLFIALHCNARSMQCEPKPDFDKHTEKVKVKYEWDVNAWVVSFKAPGSIEGLPFALVQIVKGSDGSELVASLRTETNRNVIEAHFYASDDMLNGMLLSFSYGQGCMSRFTTALTLHQLLTGLKRDFENIKHLNDY